MPDCQTERTVSRGMCFDFVLDLFDRACKEKNMDGMEEAYEALLAIHQGGRIQSFKHAIEGNMFDGAEADIWALAIELLPPAHLEYLLQLFFKHGGTRDLLAIQCGYFPPAQAWALKETYGLPLVDCAIKAREHGLAMPWLGIECEAAKRGASVASEIDEAKRMLLLIEDSSRKED